MVGSVGRQSEQSPRRFGARAKAQNKPSPTAGGVRNDETHLRIPASSIFKRFGTDLRDVLEGFTVLDERPLSVLKFVTEL